ncbi:hypothetical protein ACJRO7_032583 [Eucalyptus globulus]|uniref:Polygalacturonase n=2 Tax=Eucalyptus globulus TaxID=34317 RepID=A0ABD3JKC0_EUCGL
MAMLGSTRTRHLSVSPQRSIVSPGRFPSKDHFLLVNLIKFLWKYSLTMEKVQELVLVWIFLALFLQNASNVEGRHHCHKGHKKNPHKGSSSNPQMPPPPSPTYLPVPTVPSPEPCNSSSSGIFDVTTFGAVGNGLADDTPAFKAAWKAACAVESGVVLAPSGYTFAITSTNFSGPCKPGLVFQVDGVLLQPNGPDRWPKAHSKKQWLRFYQLNNMTLTGKGTIEGNGELWWDLPCKPHRGPNGTTLPGPCDSPVMIVFFMSANLAVNRLRIQNSPQFHMKFDVCLGVLVEKLSIYSPKLSPNTDGIHIGYTRSVGIYNSMISNGDDCISIGTGSSNVHIEGVTCGPSHGISIGSLGANNSQAWVSNITVRNAVIRDSDNGLRIKTWQGGSGSVTDISYENIRMQNVLNSIIVDQYYCSNKVCRNQSSAVYVSGLSYRNIKGTYNMIKPPIRFACSDAVGCTNIRISEVELLPHVGDLVDEPYCWNAFGVQETPTIPPVACLQNW